MKILNLEIKILEQEIKIRSIGNGAILLLLKLHLPLPPDHVKYMPLLLERGTAIWRETWR